VDRDPERSGGEWCFADALMPVKFLFDSLDKGATVEGRLEWFPDMEPRRCTGLLFS
jgi:uncharacterized protein (DUF433 family)